jgi:hypothetical protein
MDRYPGFVVRSYAAFRAARLYRVLVAPDALYFLRAGGLISASDGGVGIAFDPGQAAVAAIVRWIGRRSIDKARAALEGDPEKLVRSSRKHFKIAAEDVVSSRLDPPALLGHGFHYARWQVVVPGRKATYQVEDHDSLNAALDHLPGLLGPRLVVNVDRPFGGDRVRPRLMG